MSSECDLAVIYSITAFVSLLLALSEGLAQTSHDANSIIQLVGGIIKKTPTADQGPNQEPGQEPGPYPPILPDIPHIDPFGTLPRRISSLPKN